MGERDRSLVEQELQEVWEHLNHLRMEVSSHSANSLKRTYTPVAAESFESLLTELALRSDQSVLKTDLPKECDRRQEQLWSSFPGLAGAVPSQKHSQ